MSTMLETASALGKAIALLAMLPLAIGIVERKVFSPSNKSIASAVLFSLTAIITMATPVILMPGLVVDGRSTVVGLAAAMGGPISAVIVPLVAGAYRYFVIGGVGAVPGSVDILLSGLLGYLWGHFWVKGRQLTFSDLFVGGAVLSLPVAVAIKLLPEGPDAMLLAVAPMLVAADVCGALILGWLLQRERRLIDQEKNLDVRANYDPLTGAANRHCLFKSIEYLAIPKDREICSIALFDVDYFKRVNDAHGHIAGDAILCEFTEILHKNAGAKDLVVRMGGEEFMLLMPGVNNASASARARRILYQVRESVFKANGVELRLTVSSGVTSFRPTKNNFTEVYAAADLRLHRAKQTGRDKVVTDVIENLLDA